MSLSTCSRGASILRAAASITVILAIATVLLRFPPTQFNFYPQCPIHRYLGLLCPGCGTTRALAALFRGHFAEAMRFNALTTLSLPFLAGWIVLARKPLRWPQPPPAAIYAALFAAALFTVGRNL